MGGGLTALEGLSGLRSVEKGCWRIGQKTLGDISLGFVKGPNFLGSEVKGLWGGVKTWLNPFCRGLRTSARVEFGEELLCPPERGPRGGTLCS